MAKTAILSVRITSDADGKGFRKAIREIKAFERNAKSTDSTTSRLAAGFKRLGASTARMAAGLARSAVQASALTTAIGGIAAPLAAAGTAAAGALGPILALSAAMVPAAIGSAALAVGTLKSAFSGFGDALSASDPAAFAEAIAKLPPAAQSAVTALKGIKDSFSDIGREVQESFWANVSNIGDLAVLVAPIREAMLGLAADFGNATAGLVSFVSSGTGLSAMRTLIANSSTAAASLGYAFADVTKGIIAVGAAASPIFADIAAKLATMAEGWAASMTQGFSDGSLQTFFTEAVAKAQQLFGVLSQLGSIVGAVFSAMSAAGAPFLGTIGQIITATEQWVTSAQGMSTLTSIFSALTAAVGAVLPIVMQLAGIVGGTLAPAFAGLVTTIAPVVGQIVTAFAGVLQAVMPLVPLIGQLAALLGGVLAGAITALTPVFSALAQIIGGVLSAAIQAITPMIPMLVATFQQLAGFAMQLMPAIQTLATAFMQLMGPIMQLVGALLPGLVAIIGALMPVISAVIQGVAGFVSSLAPLISAAAQLAGPILGALAAILGTVASAIAPVIRLVVQLALQVLTGSRAVNGLKTAFGAVRGAVSAAVGVFNTVRNAISSVVGMVSSLIGALGSIRWPSPPSWLSSMFGEDASMFGVVTGTPAIGGMMQAAASDPGGFLRLATSRPAAPATTPATVVNINVSGAIDPRATADQIRGILRDDSRTRGLTTAGGYGVWQ